MIGLTSFIKHQEITGLFTSTSSALMGGTSITDGHISTLTDSIILLRYVEMFGDMQRGITVLKMRGSAHDKGIRQFNIAQDGMHLGPRFTNVTGILAGTPQVLSPGELEAAWVAHEETLTGRRVAEGGAPDSGERRKGSDRRRGT